MKYVFSPGWGWLTIKLKELTVWHIECTGKRCDRWTQCDPYVKLYINDVQVLQTDSKDDTAEYNIDKIYSTPTAIPRISTIKIEIWDANIWMFSEEKIWVLEGSIDTFIENPIRYGKIVEKRYHFMDDVLPSSPTDVTVPQQNVIETDVFWQDETE